MTIGEITFEAFKQGREQGRKESAAEIERLEHAINRLLAWCESEAGNGSNLSDEQVEDELESIELARAALQPKEG